MYVIICFFHTRNDVALLYKTGLLIPLVFTLVHFGTLFFLLVRPRNICKTLVWDNYYTFFGYVIDEAESMRVETYPYWSERLYRCLLWRLKCLVGRKFWKIWWSKIIVKEEETEIRGPLHFAKVKSKLIYLAKQFWD